MAILINDNTARVQYTATAGQTVFTVPYEFFANSDLKVYNGDTLLSYNVSPSSSLQYSVVGAGVTGGGSITLGGSGAALGNIITIVRDLPIQRLTDFPNAGPFNIQALNAELDKITAVEQNLETELDNRVLRLSDSDTPTTLNALPNVANRKNKLLGFDVQGQPVGYDSASLATLVAYATAFADTFTGNGTTTNWTLSGDPAVIANLDVSINGVTQVPLVDYTLSGTTLTTTTPVPNGAVMLVKFKEGLPNYSGDAQDVRYNAGFSGAVQQSVEAKLAQTVSIEDFGAVGDGVTDDTAAFIACLNSNPTSSGFDVQLQAKTYKISNAALYFTRRIRFFGVSRNATILDFSSCTTVVNAPYNAHIIFVHSNNIAGSSSFTDPITLPSGTVGDYGEMGGLFDLTVKCNPAVSDGNGVFYNVAANSSNILVRDANLHNIVVAGNADNLQTRGGTAGPSGVDIGGNSNNGVYNNLKAQFAVNGDGIHVNGADGNANLFLHPDASSNKGWGVNDASTLGNTFSQGHTAANLYGAYRSRPASANRATFISPYTEGGQGTDNSNTFFEMSSRAIIVGALGVTPDGVFPAINSENDGLVAHQTLSVMDAANTEDTGGTFGRVGRGLLSMRTTDGLILEFKRNSSAYTGLYYGTEIPILFRNNTSGAVTPSRPFFQNGFALSTAHAQTVGTAAPTTGTYVRGEIVWNTTPSAGGYAGWICTAGGTPGTWKEFGAIAP